MFEKLFFESQNVKISYYDSKGNYDRILLFIHGWLESKENMLKFANSLKLEYRVILVDLRGHGESSTPNGAYTLDEFATDVIDLLDHLQIVGRNVVLIGRSMGGMVITKIFEKVPERCKALVFLNSSLKYKAYNVSGYLLDVLIPYLLRINPKALTRFARIAFGFHVSSSDLNLVKETLNLANKKVGYLSYRNSISNVNLIHVIENSNIPVLSVGGGLDTVLPSGHAKLIANKARFGYFRFFPGCGHFSNMEYQSELATTISRFLKSLS